MEDASLDRFLDDASNGSTDEPVTDYPDGSEASSADGSTTPASGESATPDSGESRTADADDSTVTDPDVPPSVDASDASSSTTGTTGATNTSVGSTMLYAPDGAACVTCGAVVERRWQSADGPRCGACKEW